MPDINIATGLIVELKARHLAAFTRHMREMRPDEFESVLEMPDDEAWLVTNTSAALAGWFKDHPPDDVEWVGDLTHAESEALALAVYEARAKAREIDPNS